MAGFDQHERCARCRDKKLGSDPCVKGKQRKSFKFHTMLLLTLCHEKILTF